MKKVAIVGAGQAGLQLGFTLLAQGDQVQIYTDKTAEEVFNGPPLPVPVQFYPSLSYEKDLGLRFWEEERASQVEGVRFSLYDPAGNQALSIQAPLSPPAQTVDLRLKFSVWMREFEQRGGHIVISRLSIPLLEQLTDAFDLVVVATGRGDTANLFEKDPTRTAFDQPQRKLALFYVRDLRLNYSQSSNCQGASFNIMPGCGELLSSPFLSKNKERIFYLLLEAVPGGPLDVFDAKAPVEKQLEAVKDFFRSTYPSLYEMIRAARLDGAGEWVCGAVTPVVKKPIGYLPSGRAVMGIGDTVIVHDPLMAQGLNNAAKMADFVGKAIRRQSGKLNEEWMRQTFESYWETARYNTLLTNTMLGVPAPHQIEILGAASQNLSVARDLVTGIGDARQLFPWFFDAREAAAYLMRRHNQALGQ